MNCSPNRQLNQAARLFIGYGVNRLSSVPQAHSRMSLNDPQAATAPNSINFILGSTDPAGRHRKYRNRPEHIHEPATFW